MGKAEQCRNSCLQSHAKLGSLLWAVQQSSSLQSERPSTVRELWC